MEEYFNKFSSSLKYQLHYSLCQFIVEDLVIGGIVMNSPIICFKLLLCNDWPVNTIIVQCLYFDQIKVIT